MVKPLRHRQTKGAATDMFYLTPPRHISTLPFATETRCPPCVRFSPNADTRERADTSQKKTESGLIGQSHSRAAELGRQILEFWQPVLY